jgi:RND family efflux transporter MFP subunit
MKKLTVLILFPLSIWILQACSSSEGKQNTSPKDISAISVKVLPLQKTAIASEVLASGQFTTDDETFLSFKTGGVIERIFVKEGDAIREGQVLATLNFTEINAQVAQAKLGYEKALRDHQRVSNLYRDSVATLEQFQNAKTGLDVATQQYEAARFNRSYSEIRALSNGFVLRKLASEGQVIQPGTSVFQTNGASKGKWLLKTGVSDKDWARLSIGDKALVRSDASSEVIEGFVSRRSEGTDPQTGSFLIEITLTGKLPSSIASGLFGKASIKPSKVVNAWAIPYDALLDGDGQSGYVFTTNDSKTAHRTEVQVAGIERDHVIITRGLENAQAIIVSGSAYLRDNSPIQIIEN